MRESSSACPVASPKSVEKRTTDQNELSRDPLPNGRRRCPGQLRVPGRAVLVGDMYVLWTGAAWRDVPAETVSCSDVTPGAGCETGARPTREIRSR